MCVQRLHHRRRTLRSHHEDPEEHHERLQGTHYVIMVFAVCIVTSVPFTHVEITKVFFTSVRDPDMIYVFKAYSHSTLSHFWSQLLFYSVRISF